jgi:hypothetical protein
MPIILATQEARDQEDRGLKLAQANSLRDHLGKTHHKKKGAGGIAQGIGPEFNPQYSQKKEET